jgi:hypothetical protein
MTINLQSLINGAFEIQGSRTKGGLTMLPHIMLVLWSSSYVKIKRYQTAGEVK